MPLIPVTVISIIFLLWTKKTLAPQSPPPKTNPDVELIKAVAKVLEERSDKKCS